MTVGADGAIIVVGYRHNGADWDFVVRRYGSTQLADFAPSTTDWTAGSGMFGACLRAVGGGAVLDGSTWSSTGSCTAANSDPWRAVSIAGAAGTKVAAAPASTLAATVNLRFGARTPSSLRAGRYVAPISFDVIAPSA